MYGKRINSKGRRSAVTAGALLIVGLVAGIFSVVPVIDGADYLAGASANENQVLIGAFFSAGNGCGVCRRSRCNLSGNKPAS